MKDEVDLSPEELLGKLRDLKKKDRARQSIYVSVAIYKEFTKICGEGNRSAVLEHLMSAFIAKAKKR